MAHLSKLAVASLFISFAAHAQPGVTEPTDATSNDDITPPSSVESRRVDNPSNAYVTTKPRVSKYGTTERWGGGVRLTGLSGIGALPGVNYGGEVAGLVRRDEMFAELAIGRWKPEHTYVVTEMPEHVELALNVWTLRAGWASMKMPLRGWLLTEVGEVSAARQMGGVVARMMTGDDPQMRAWKAVGAGIGVAWPMSDNARLVGAMEIAVPVARESVTLTQGEYQPDPMAARYSMGFEVGWR